MKIVFWLVWEIVGNTFTLEGIFIEDFKKTADAFAVFIEFGIQARALYAPEGGGIVDEAFTSTSTGSIFKNRCTKSSITSNTGVVINKVLAFIADTLSGFGQDFIGSTLFLLLFHLYSSSILSTFKTYRLSMSPKIEQKKIEYTFNVPHLTDCQWFTISVS